jgi:hypothetical protein
MFHDRTLFWCLNEAGILLEIVGALVLVISEFNSRNRLRHIQDTFDADLAIHLRDAITGQAVTELWGFVVFGGGLLMRGIAAFGR